MSDAANLAAPPPTTSPEAELDVARCQRILLDLAELAGKVCEFIAGALDAADSRAEITRQVAQFDRCARIVRRAIIVANNLGRRASAAIPPEPASLTPPPEAAEPPAHEPLTQSARRHERADRPDTAEFLADLRDLPAPDLIAKLTHELGDILDELAAPPIPPSSPPSPTQRPSKPRAQSEAAAAELRAFRHALLTTTALPPHAWEPERPPDDTG